MPANIMTSVDLAQGALAIEVDTDPTLELPEGVQVGTLIFYAGLWYRRVASGVVSSLGPHGGAHTMSGGDPLPGGAINSGMLGFGCVLSGAIASGQIGVEHLASGVIQATSLTSGSVRSGHLGDGAVVSGSIASGSIGGAHLSSGAVRSGHLGDGAVASGSIASGQIGAPHISSGAVLSGHIGNNAVVSGSIASGQLDWQHLSSGTFDYQFEVSSGRSTTTSATYQTKVSLTTPAYTGRYLIMWSAIVDDPANLGRARLYNVTDGVEIEYFQRHKATDAEVLQHVGGFSEITFAGAAKTFSIQWRDEGGGNTQGIREARIAIWRVA